MVKVTDKQVDVWIKMIGEGYTYREIGDITCECYSLIFYHVHKSKGEE